MTRKTKVAIIGTGNLGSDLLLKIIQSPYLECTMFAGQNVDSSGIAMAQKMDIPTSTESINIIVKNPEICEIVFDATTVGAHRIHAPILKKLKKFTIDLTPSKIGKMCIPLLNMEACLKETNINMITCGGQATIPLINSVLQIHPETSYVEIVGSISSKSAGIGTRNNIDEYTQTTKEGIKSFTTVPEAKAIIVLNPADPPIVMHNTIYAQIGTPDMRLLIKTIKKTVSDIQSYVPGFKLTNEPIYDRGVVTIITEVIGKGDFLPKYAGNLDIINCAAIAAAESYAKKRSN